MADGCVRSYIFPPISGNTSNTLDPVGFDRAVEGGAAAGGATAVGAAAGTTVTGAATVGTVGVCIFLAILDKLSPRCTG